MASFPVTEPQWMSDELNCMLSDVDSWSFPWGKVANPLAQQWPEYGLKFLRKGNRLSFLFWEAASRIKRSRRNLDQARKASLCCHKAPYFRADVRKHPSLHPAL